MSLQTPSESATHANTTRLNALVAAVLLAAALPAAAFAATTGDEGIEWKPERAPAGPVLIVVGLAEQRAQIFRNGVRIGSTPISSGKQRTPTPTGLFSILEKKRVHFSNLYDDAPMPNMQRLTWDGVAMHAGRLPGYAASHGCVRLPHAMSDLLFGVTERGGLVAIVDSFPETTVVDMTKLAVVDNDRNTDAVLPSPAAGAFGPVSVVLSTSDAELVVMRNGVQIGRAPVELQPGTLGGERLYVGRSANHWEELPSVETPLGNPRDAFAAGQLRVDPAFGSQLEPLLVAGTTVMITDLPLGNHTPYGTHTPDTSAMPLVSTPFAGDLVSTIDVAP